MAGHDADRVRRRRVFYIPGYDPIHPRRYRELYRKEGASLEQAFYDREKAQAERREYFLANPPKPKDVTISFWKRRGPSQIALKELERRQER